MKNTIAVSSPTNPTGRSLDANFRSRRSSAACQSKFAEFKTNLVTRLASEFPEVQPRLVRQAVVEADALASLTGLPCLVLPTLAEEKVAGLRNWTIHQQAVSRNSALGFAA
jgi:hypothetical protein